MNVLIIEDEIIAQQALSRMLTENFDNITVCGILDGVSQTVEWFNQTEVYPDLIFMDVELSDGKCFDIFDRIRIECPIIMVTAYNHYAVKAFEIDSIDYLLKPVSVADLERALNRYHERRNSSETTTLNIEALRSIVSGGGKRYKQRYLLRYNDKIIVVDTQQIAYFYSEDGSTYLMTSAGDKYLMDVSLDMITRELDPTRFFRISRSCIVADSAIGNVAKRLGNRIKLSLKPSSDVDSFVSRSKTSDFLAWLESGK